jgi:hypothetical protein
MISTCPSCLNRVEHANDVTKVTCSDCGTNFDTFYDPSGGAPSESKGTNTGDFTESKSAFQDIRSFGEMLGSESSPTVPEKEESSMPSVTSHNEASLSTTLSPSYSTGELGTDCIMLSSGTLSGYRIESYLAPLSTWAPLNQADPDPLKPAYAALWESAQKLGATAVLGIQFVISSASDRVLISGTPVRALKS